MLGFILVLLVAVLVGAKLYFRYLEKRDAEITRLRVRGLQSARRVQEASQHWETGMYPDLKKKPKRRYVQNAPSYFDHSQGA